MDKPLVRDNYTLIKILGKGSEGKVWLAENKGFQVALKEININIYDGLPSLIEIDIYKKCYHPNLSRLIDIFVDKASDYPNSASTFPLTSHSIYLVMPLADSTLDEYLKSKLTMKTKYRLIYELLSCVSFLHNAGIYHCDLKPENILIKDGKVMVSDLGLASYIGTSSPCTPSMVFAPPELLINNFIYDTDTFVRRFPADYQEKISIRTYDATIDIWSLGAVIAYILTEFNIFTQMGNEVKMTKDD